MPYIKPVAISNIVLSGLHLSPPQASFHIPLHLLYGLSISLGLINYCPNRHKTYVQMHYHTIKIYAYH